MAFHLCKRDEKGQEILLGTFESEELLLAAIPEKPVLRVLLGSIVLDPYGDLSKYVVKPFEMNVLRDDTGEIDLPDISLTVPSESDPEKTYGVAIRDGDFVACTCAAFQYAEEDDYRCKHMRAVAWSPAIHGLRVVENGYRVSDRNGGLALPGSYYQRHPYATRLR